MNFRLDLWLREILWNWLAREYSDNANRHINEVLTIIRKELRKDYLDSLQESKAFALEFRDFMRKQSREEDVSERHHKELIEAIKSLTPEGKI